MNHYDREAALTALTEAYYAGKMTYEEYRSEWKRYAYPQFP